jgi:putative addiction module component (TIGR02574 family)
LTQRTPKSDQRARAGQRIRSEADQQAVAHGARTDEGKRDLPDIAGTWIDDPECQRAIAAQHRVTPRLEDAWGAEIGRRIAEIDSGKVKLVPWSRARRRLRLGLRSARRER